MFSENFFGQTKFLVKKKSGQNSFWSYKNFGHENILVNKIFLVKKNLGKEKSVKRIFQQKKVSVEKFQFKIFFDYCQKKIGQS